MKCHYCDNDAVTGVGVGFCADHLGGFEVKFFERAVREEISSTKEMQKFFKWAFGTAFPKLSMLADWHSRIPRPENLPEEWDRRGVYVERQDSYIRKILKEYRERRSHAIHDGTAQATAQQSRSNENSHRSVSDGTDIAT